MGPLNGYLFQSAPVITDGRSHSVLCRVLSVTGFNPRPSSLTGDPRRRACQILGGAMFQSAPVITDGRSAVLEKLVKRVEAVSIRARHH